MHQKIREAQRDIIEAFNHKAKNGIAKIKQICEKENIKPAEAIANFFQEQNKNLDLEAMGEYLGAKETENKEVLQAFAEQMDFKGKSIIDGMRAFFSKFQMPKEGQKIGELISAFSQAYVNQNPDGNFDHPDAAELISFQIMLLNTDLHNPKNTNKMTMDQHKNQVKGGNKAAEAETEKNFNTEFLESIYNEIKTNPIVFNFAKTSPGYEITISSLKKDPTFKRLDSVMGSDVIDPKRIIPTIGDNVMATIDKPKPWISFLTGYEGTITLTDEKTKAKATIQVYNPGFFSKLFFGEQPRVIVQPVYQEGKTRESIDLAAKVTANFATTASSIKATYDFEKVDLQSSYDQHKKDIFSEKQKAYKDNVPKEETAAEYKNQPK